MVCSQLQCLSLEGGLDGWVPYQESCSFSNIAKLSKVDTWTEHACLFGKSAADPNKIKAAKPWMLQATFTHQI